MCCNKVANLSLKIARNSLTNEEIAMEKIEESAVLTAKCPPADKQNCRQEICPKDAQEKAFETLDIDTPSLASSATAAEKSSQKSVKWSSELLETLLYHPLQKCHELKTDNTLVLKDLPNIVLNGSLSSSAPRWSLGSLVNATSSTTSETGIRLVDSSIVCHSQLFGLVEIPNHAFEKQVVLIYTLNDWKQVLTLPLVYHSSSADGRTDMFQFHIDLQSIPPLSAVLCFCFKYTYGVGPDASTVYENNYQRNFSMNLTVSLPPHKDTFNNHVSPIKKRSKPKKLQSSTTGRRMVSLTLQDSRSSFLLVPPPKSMMATYSLSYAYS